MRRLLSWAATAAILPVLAACTGAQDGAEPDTGAADARPIPAECEETADVPKRQMRGVWLTTVRNIDWPSEPGLDAEEQRDELRAQLDDARDLGLNAVFFHVRPTADAVYASDKEPWARYLTGEQGGDPGYDPLEFAVEEAHARGLELHAWFNPYRVGWDDPDLEGLADDHPAVEHPDWLVEYDDQGWLDPGLPEVREWVTGVVMDVVDRYDVDGVHFDDYFYPYPADGEEFDDDASWKEHGGDADSRDAWRRSNVDALIADVHTAIGESKPWVRFGVSPFGIWRNSDSDADGSDTEGLESYSAQYADTREWIREGSVDYLVPQLYWERGFSTADYEVLAPWWAEEVRGTGVDLYIGQAAYRVGEDGEKAWKGDGVLARQLDYSGELPEVGGDVFFSMQDMRGRAEGAMERLREDHYALPALPPEAQGGEGRPDPVGGLQAALGKGGEVRVSWDPVEGARSYAVYRVSEEEADDPCALGGRENLVGVVGAEDEPSFSDSGTGEDVGKDGDGAWPRYFVTALDRYRTEGAPGEGTEVDLRED
ncbi:family 10 glycosylhydrolase [Nocardiopsis sp. RSe5-2]|uniref:Family 10 glycosylhydrolase n=1 Tax=Nocardiopsis endophytica TaxID=3018445 RepID=A0ABT4U2V3_9ACTN|nr:family 10 glycosylhydrolase [Nocardiopsis endophytica]MDA2811286.1 family 10 glycosylhydrolase [Nocardiopsis endophytica]